MFFRTLLQMSLTGGVMIAAVLLTRPFLKRWRTYGVLLLLWAFCWVLLLIPFRPSSPVSVYNAANEIPVLSGAFSVGEAFDTLTSADADAPLPANAQPSVLIWLWLTGTCAVTLYLFSSIIGLHIRFRGAVPRADLCRALAGKGRKIRVYASSRTKTPITYGILRPRIVLPMFMDDKDETALGYVLLHECRHIRNRDALMNLLWMCGLAVHWFNPLVWVAWRCLRRDLENRCDAHVVKSIGVECHKSYAQTLLNMTPVKQKAYPLAFGSSPVGSRIQRILAYRPVTKRAVCAALTVFLCVVAVFATNPTRAVIAEQIADTLELPVAPEKSAVIPPNEGYNLYSLDYFYDENGEYRRSYNLCGTYATLDDVYAYFLDHYQANEVETVKPILADDHFTIAGFGFSPPDPAIGFSIQILAIDIQTGGELVSYELLDRSTFESHSGENNISVMRYITRFSFPAMREPPSEE